MISYLILFGRTPDLAWIEFSTLFPLATRIAPQVALYVSEENQHPRELIDLLGGTVKIARSLSQSDAPDPEALAGILTAEGGKVTFGVSFYTPAARYPKEFLEKIKQILAGRGIKSRYLIPEHQTALSSVQVAGRDMQEIVVVEASDGTYYLGKTEAVQDFRRWQERDYGRPHADAKLGMLPPKVARMAVNIATGTEKKGKTLLDPFCGMGTVLSEGYVAGCNVIGGDLSEPVLRKAEANLTWLKSRYPTADARNVRFVLSDATHISDHIDESSVDAIVTEPFMGTPRLGEGRVGTEKARNIIKGLDKLMIGSLKDWKKILKPGGRIFVAMPSIVMGARRFSVKKAIDTCENLGYTKVLGPITYAREQAVVQRDFYLLERS
jgi:tRNA G10  N-methylase Trm11